jgi:hypothetical protein
VNGVSRTWHLPKIQPLDLDQLRNAALARADLNNWNESVEKSDVKGLLSHGLTKVRDLLEAAERIV